MSDWVLEHPVLAVLILTAAGAVGGLLGVGAAYVTTAAHLLSPDNFPAGLLMGFGSVVLGFTAGCVLLGRLGAR